MIKIRSIFNTIRDAKKGLQIDECRQQVRVSYVHTDVLSHAVIVIMIFLAINNRWLK